MNILLQALTAFFAVIGLFETVWQILLFFTKHSVRGQRTRIIIETNEDTDPAFLAEDLHLLSNRLTACKDTRVWLLCNPGAKQEKACRYLAERNSSIRVIPPEKLAEEINAFLQEQ